MTDEHQEHEALAQRLRRIDPSPLDVPVDPPDSPSGIALMRSIMDTTTTDTTDTEPDSDTSTRPTRTRHRRAPWMRPLAAAAAVAVLGVGAVVAVTAVRGSSEDEPVVASYELAPGDPMMMCLPVADVVPAPSAQAFGGTVTAVDAGRVVLEVDRWYTAGEADVVELRAGTDVSTALDGVEFVEGERYLVTTVDGVVSICGMSAPATPELEQLYEQWYG